MGIISTTLCKDVFQEKKKFKRNATYERFNKKVKDGKNKAKDKKSEYDEKSDEPAESEKSLDQNREKRDPREMTFLKMGLTGGDMYLRMNSDGTSFRKTTRHKLTNAKQAASEALPPPQMQSNVVDLTHDTLPEVVWRPIKKFPEPMPPLNIISDKVNLHAWELNLNKEHFAYTFNRIYFDNEIFKQFLKNGQIIKMLVDPKDLQDAKEFWKLEDDISKLALKYIKELQTKKVYDFHKIKPEAYDMKAG